MKNFFENKVKAKTLCIFAALCAAILIVMDLVLFPAIQKNTMPVKAFDLQFHYTHTQAIYFLTHLGAQAKNIYLHIQLPLDFVFAFLYTFLFIALFIKLNEKGKRMIVLPIMLFISDIIENILSVIMLKKGALSSYSLTLIASNVTLAKSVLTYVCSIITIILLIIFIVRKKRKSITVK